MNQPDTDADDAMAADYVMGLLDDAEHAAAERRIADRRRRLPSAVSAWRERLADLDFTAEETAPSPALWQRIADATRIAPIDALPSARAALRGATLWDDIRFWRVAGIGGALAALLFAVIMIGALTTSRHLRQRPDCAGPEQARLCRRAGERRDQRGRRHRQRIFEWPGRAYPATPDRGSRRPHAAGLDACGIAPSARNRSASPVSRARCSSIWSRCRKPCRISCSRSRWSRKAARPSDDRPVRSCSRATRRGRCSRPGGKLLTVQFSTSPSSSDRAGSHARASRLSGRGSNQTDDRPCPRPQPCPRPFTSIRSAWTREPWIIAWPAGSAVAGDIKAIGIAVAIPNSSLRMAHRLQS